MGGAFTSKAIRGRAGDRPALGPTSATGMCRRWSLSGRLGTTTALCSLNATSNRREDLDGVPPSAIVQLHQVEHPDSPTASFCGPPGPAPASDRQATGKRGEAHPPD